MKVSFRYSRVESFCLYPYLKMVIKRRILNLGMSVRRSSSRCSGGRLLAMTQWPLKTPFFSFFSSFFSRRLLFSQKERSDQKTYLEKVDMSAPKLRGRPFFRPRWPFWGPLAAILDFLRRLLFSQKECLDLKTYLREN